MRKRTVHPVNDVSLGLAREETLGLVGESGSGKTMMSLAVMGLLPQPFGRIVAGEILFDGQNIAALSDTELRKIRGDRISMVFQEPMTSLDPLFTIGSQIVEAIRAHRGFSRGEAKELAI
jgi:ABC-type microcin C transport system duplicated ATPase subunit YejF